MKIVMTMMVRDEIDIIAAMVEHHLAQGVDLIIATDNASIDGTAEVLAAYEAAGKIELHHDPEHRKQQGVVVTRMARRAYTEHGADWVVNADADEFFVPVDTRLTLRAALERIPLELGAFTVGVVNLVGAPIERGSGIPRALWRDLRPVQALNDIGIHAHPTPNALHRGDPDVTVSQGNHFVSIKSKGQPAPPVELQTLHLPWRSFAQLEAKVTAAGRAYAANPHLRPSKNHHGMSDFRRYEGGRLRQIWALRQPLERDLIAGEESGWFLRDRYLRPHLEELLATALCPDLLAACLDNSADVPVPPVRHEQDGLTGRAFLALERERSDALDLAAQEAARTKVADDEAAKQRKAVDRANRRIAALEQEPLGALARRTTRRLVRAVGRRARRGAR
ncbi:MAG TPA: glycosyltransferase family 2 protein [Sporichthya sp.]|nr:glycosyltransferase family 2 protein [Sporichthya sp.]